MTSVFRSSHVLQSRWEKRELPRAPSPDRAPPRRLRPARPTRNHRSVRASRALHDPATGRPGHARGRNLLGRRRSGQQNTGVTCRRSPRRRCPWPVSCPGLGWGVWRKDSQNPSSRPESRSYRVTTTGGSGERRGRRGSPSPAGGLRMRRPAPSAHALLAPVRRRALINSAPRRHHPQSMLLVAPGDPLSQIFVIVFRLGPWGSSMGRHPSVSEKW